MQIRTCYPHGNTAPIMDIGWIYNDTPKTYSCKNWRIVWSDPFTDNIYFSLEIESIGGPFNPGEYILLKEGRGNSCFVTNDAMFPKGYWRLYFGACNPSTYPPCFRLTLYGTANDVLASFISARGDNTKNLLSVLRNPKVFIGHGRNDDWKLLKEHLTDKHGMKCFAFESEERSGLLIPEIIKQLGKAPDVALLVLTGEDQTIDGKIRARQNVIHELGLFQNSLNWGRIIPIVENGVEMPSNTAGMNELRFEKGRIKEVLGDLIAIFKREGLY